MRSSARRSPSPSSKPQTTRHVVRGIVHRPDASWCSSTPRACTGRARCSASGLNHLVRDTLLEVDVIGFCLPADERVGPGDRFIAAELTSCGGPHAVPGRSSRS
jgi:GTP-binding protein Era